MYHTNYNHGWNCGCNEAPYATKGAAYGIGIPALVAGGLALLNQNGGGLGNLFCGGNNGVANAVLAQKDAEIAELKAERYSDNAAETQANRLLVNYLKPYGDAIAETKANEARMQAEIECLKKTGELREEILRKDIQLARQEAQCCCQQNANAIAAIGQTVQSITRVGIPNVRVWPGWGDVTVAPATTTTTTTAAAA